MKLSISPNTIFRGFTFLALVVFLSACDTWKKAKKPAPTADVPQAYNTKSSYRQAMLDYVGRYKDIAIREMQRTGIPASIKLAQGLLESNAGRSDLAVKGKNHFGIKCHSDWTGERYYKEDDDKDPVTGQLIKSCFRVFTSPEESFTAHSEFIRDPRKVNRYGFLFQLPSNDYDGWAHGLEKAGYATATDYAEKLIRIIEDYQLAQYDNAGGAVNPVPTPVNPNSGTNVPTNNPTTPSTNTPVVNSNTAMLPSSGTLNDARYILASSNTTLEQVAARNDVRLANLIEYNDGQLDPERALKPGTIVFLQQKRNFWRGQEKFHRVQACETMFDIAQRYGIKMARLYSKNHMNAGEQPAVGEKIAIRLSLFERVDKPALRDTFGEWRQCNPVETKPATPPTVSRPSTTPGSLEFDIVPGGQTGNSGNPNSGSANPNVFPTPTQPTSNNGSRPIYPSTEVTRPNDDFPEVKPNTNGNNTTTNGGNTNSRPSTNLPSKPNTTPTSPTNTNPTTNTNPRPVTKPTTPATTTPSQKPTTSPATTSGAQFHTVVQGETLWGISRKYNTTVDAIKQLNGLPDNVIKPGQQIRVK